MQHAKATTEGMVRITRAEYDRLTKSRLSIERVAEIQRINPRYARSIELHGCDNTYRCAVMAEITGADEMDYTVPRHVEISRREYVRLVRAAEPPKRPYRPIRRRRLAGHRRPTLSARRRAMTAILEDRLREIEVVSLRPGKHNPPNGNGIEMCAMEAVAYVAGEPWSDEPQCACPVIAAAVRYFNDDLRSDEERNEWIKPLIPRLVGTRDEGKIVPRAYIAVNFALQVFTPLALEAAGLTEEAQVLRGLDPVTCTEAARVARVARVAEAAQAVAIGVAAASIVEPESALAARIVELAAEAAEWAAQAVELATEAAEWADQAASLESAVSAAFAAFATSRIAEAVRVAGDARRAINRERRAMVEAMLAA